MSDSDRTILLAHDKPEKREQYRRLLAESQDHWEVELASCGEQALEIAQSRDLCCAVLDFLMPNTRRDEREGRVTQEGGLWALERIAEKKSYLPVILFSQRDPTEANVEAAMRLGVFDFLVRDHEHFESKFLIRVRNAAEAFASRVKTLEKKSKILYKSGLMEAVILRARNVARSTSPVLIVGETGTGKDMVAEEIHECSPRRHGPFLSLNCAALPETLVESEMFGHVEGAFTGATRSRKGKLEQAHKGTLFLDEIGDMTLATQAKLLRAIEEQEFQPVGSEEARKVDVRIVCATNKDLEELITQGKFREDLYYRIRFEKIEIPPLRSRREDIPVLVAAFVAEHCRRLGRQIVVQEKAIRRLTALRLRGNVRELQGIVQAALSRMEPSETELTEFHLEAESVSEAQQSASVLLPDVQTVLDAVRGGGVELDKVLEDLKSRVIDAAVAECNGSGAAAAKILKMNPHTLRRYLRQRRGAQGAPVAEEGASTEEADDDEPTRG